MYRNTDGSPKGGKIVGHIVLALVALILFFGSFGIVGVGERGVQTRLGRIVKIVDNGFYFKVPLIDTIHKMDVHTQTAAWEGDSSLAAASKDLQDVKIAIVTNYHIDGAKVNDIYQQFNSTDNYQASVIEPIIRDTVKAVASQYTAEELVTKRVEFNDKAFSALTDRLSAKYVTVEKLNITNFKFSDSFEAAIEAKATAVQNAEAAKNKLAQVQYEGEQKVTTAKADAEAIKIQSQAINSQGGADYVLLQAIKAWDGHGCTNNCFGVGTQMPVPFLNLNK